ncbi:hybrid sensor histidine kinase/response regulator [bacterium]|nr:hybrid sensor histidine kinase/response regulator [bacterium]
MALKKPLIMIVEDEDQIRRKLEEALVVCGYQAIAANGAAEALQLLPDIQPDLILSDVKMPDMTGLEFKSHLDEHTDWGTIPFVFVSALTGPHNIRNGMELAADDYITKPFKLSELVGVINKRLEKERKKKAKYERSMAQLTESLQLIFPHELSTPVTVIYGMAEFLQTLDLENSKDRLLTHKMLESIAVSAIRLKDLSDKFNLAVRTSLNNGSSIQSEMAEEIPYELQSLIELVCRQVSRKMNARDRIKIELEPGRSTSNKVFVERIVEEVVKNAFQYSENNALITVKGKSNQEYYELDIKDCGPGMTPDQIASIGLFRQFDRKRAEQQGIGLGLAVSKRLLELIGGEISFTSGETGGLLVSIQFPLSLLIENVV